MGASMDLNTFNALPEPEARRTLASCLDAPSWVEAVLAGRPYDDRTALSDGAARSAAALTDEELDAAAARHPRIGERAGEGHDSAFSDQEQSGVDADDEAVAGRLAEGNRAYEEKFGRVFLIRAAGRDGSEILAELERRLGNDEGTEKAEAIAALRQIALLRLEQVVS